MWISKERYLSLLFRAESKEFFPPRQEGDFEETIKFLEERIKKTIEEEDLEFADVLTKALARLK